MQIKGGLLKLYAGACGRGMRVKAARRVLIRLAKIGDDDARYWNDCTA